MPLTGLSRASLDEITVRVIRPAKQARPDVRLIALNGRRHVVKDYAAKGTLFKRLLGVYLVWRERVALARAEGIPGVPRVSGTMGPTALVTEYLDATEVTSAPPGLLTAEFFERLTQAVNALHARGIVHGDLKKLENILVTAEGEPALVDFTAAFVTGSNPVTALVLPFIVEDDLRAICKLKQRCAPHLLSEREACFLHERSAIERAYRRVRERVRLAVKRAATPEHERSSVRQK